MREIALHMLDLAENSVSAGAKTVTILVCEDLLADRLTVSIADDGRGMDAETVRRVVDPFYTTRTTRRVGLGIPLLKGAAEESGGKFEISSEPGRGTLVNVEFQHSHIDRMPLGNLPTTFLQLSLCHPETHWVFGYTARGPLGTDSFDFDDAPVKETLEGIPLTDPEVLSYLRENFDEGIRTAKQAFRLTN